MPNVVQLLGYDGPARQLYLPLLRPLAKYLQHGFRRASAEHKSSFLRAVLHGVLSGVAQLHKCDVCHRDLKIDNVLIAGLLPGECTAWAPSMMSAQLCDFGYSLMTGVNEDVDEARRCNPGTPPYIAPEVYAAREAAKTDEVGAVPCGLDWQGWQRADVYSATMMVWGLCRAKTTCFFPRVDNLDLKPHIKEEKLGELIAKGGRPRLECMDRDVDKGLQPLWNKFALPDSLLARGWSHDPTKRPTAAELQQGILELDDTLDGGGSGDGGGGGGGGGDGDGDGDGGDGGGGGGGDGSGGSGCQGGDEGGTALGSGTPKRQRKPTKSELPKGEGGVKRPRGRARKDRDKKEMEWDSRCGAWVAVTGTPAGECVP